MNTEVNNILHILVRDEKTWLSMAEEITSNSKIPAKDLHKILNKISKRTLPENYQLKYSDIK